jgi:alpha-ketoglutarate-dependent taurine dioxygenase
MELTAEAPELLVTQLSDARLPRVVSARSAGALPDAQLIKRYMERELTVAGALLLRGFAVASVSAFERLVTAVTPGLLTYEFGSTPRSQIDGRVYSSTEYPAHQWIPQHNEQSYTREWPLKVWFHCVVAASEGGATPISDSRCVYRRLSPALRARFESKGVMYVRNFGNGLDLPWQEVFRTESKQEVEAFCRRAQISCEWKDDGELRTRQVCQASARHPRTEERVWFNQAHLFHVSNLEPSIQEGLLSFLGEDELPRNAFYGDGASIEADALAEIRAAYDAETISFDWQSGDVLLVDNMLVAHGRAPFTGARKVVVAMAELYRGTEI